MCSKLSNSITDICSAGRCARNNNLPVIVGHHHLRQSKFVFKKPRQNRHFR